MEEQKQKIVIPLNNGYRLVAELSTDPDFPNEIFIGITDENDVWWQDLAIVRSHHYIPKRSSKVKQVENKYDILVYADSDNEDYTNKFTVDQYQGGTV